MRHKKLEAEAKARFTTDIATHEMKIRNDDGVFRHLTFSRPGTFCYGLHITTWPGYLCISGDMGCFVFSRLTDMFEFFRGEDINPSYWAEKMTAIDRGGHLTFSEERYQEALKLDFEGWTFDHDLDRQRAWNEITDEWDGIYTADRVEDARSKACNWVCPVTKQRFTDFWEHTLEDYSFRFLWSCFAIQWAIAHYDQMKAVPASPAAEAAHV